MFGKPPDSKFKGINSWLQEEILKIFKSYGVQSSIKGVFGGTVPTIKVNDQDFQHK